MSESVYTTARASASELRPMARRRSVVEHLRELGGYRELLANLTRKELTVRYQHSMLGFTWSMLQPVFLLIVYTAVFAILGAGFEKFSIWVLCGLLLWTFVATTLLTATTSITENASLVGKVKFPRAVLPLASVAGALVHLALQSIAFAVVLGVTRHRVDWVYMPLVPLAIVTATLVVAGIAVIIAPVNVYARDTGHLLDLLVLGWFWATPILYPFFLASTTLENNGISRWAQMANPFTPIVISIQRAIYGSSTEIGTDVSLIPDESVWWYAAWLGAIAAVALVVLAAALRLFDRAEVNMAEAL
ncbi:MAG: ABC transporter permease [Acidimicrobiia bacterium]|nr:ABC transporter permease [Acidimicrobiia bacterium]MBA3983438.1 ABC transporter permease [Acidimicrobiia bacterium]